FLRRLRDYQHGRRRGFGDSADGDLRYGAPRREPRDQRHFGLDHAGLRSAYPDIRADAGSMNRRYFIFGLTGLAGCARDSRPRLNVYNWSSYIAPETVPAFEAEFGVRVRYATYESNEQMLAEVITGNSGWDL